MKKLEISLKDVLISLAENLLPARSGHNKILEIIVEMTNSQGKKTFIKIIFWHPCNYMMVAATSFEATLEDIRENDFSVKANHDTTWKIDGFDFLRTVNLEPEEISIPLFKIIEVGDAFVRDKDRMFFFQRK